MGIPRWPYREVIRFLNLRSKTFLFDGNLLNSISQIKCLERQIGRLQRLITSEPQKRYLRASLEMITEERNRAAWLDSDATPSRGYAAMDSREQTLRTTCMHDQDSPRSPESAAPLTLTPPGSTLQACPSGIPCSRAVADGPSRQSGRPLSNAVHGTRPSSTRSTPQPPPARFADISPHGSEGRIACTGDDVRVRRSRRSRTPSGHERQPPAGTGARSGAAQPCADISESPGADLGGRGRLRDSPADSEMSVDPKGPHGAPSAGKQSEPPTAGPPARPCARAAAAATAAVAAAADDPFHADWPHWSRAESWRDMAAT